MRKFRVFYKDHMFEGREQEWSTEKAYDPAQAECVAENLELMGCYDVRLVPVRDSVIKEAA